ncbi:MAG: nucleotidyltransferase domain-containing protein [Chloroflexota bacterium]|nr:MAG: nucleotidyltransferase domain-containing protein [Chloroflexota bacterium]
MMMRMETNVSLTLEEKLDALTPFFENDARVLGVWLFGSQADGTATEQSDIDLAVLFAREMTLEEELRFETLICDLLRTDDVDIVNLNQANLLLRFRGIAGKLLYERDFAQVGDFVEETLIEFRDFYLRAQAIRQDYLVTW